jgi:AcrR family transcriptional regulator
MYDSTVQGRLLAKARDLFALNGFDGTSVRSITSAARANLGAVTYYFGSKRALYESVLEAEATPLREAVASVAHGPGTPLERIEGIVRAFFTHLQEHAALPRLIIQQLATSPDVPAGARRALVDNHAHIAKVIAAGQADGSIRPGDPRLMALSIGSQPMMLALMRDVLSRAVNIDQSDPAMFENLVDSVVAFVTAGLRGDV